MNVFCVANGQTYCINLPSFSIYYLNGPSISVAMVTFVTDLLNGFECRMPIEMSFSSLAVMGGAWGGGGKGDSNNRPRP